MAFKIVGKIKIDTRKVSAALARYCAASEKEFELLERARNPQELRSALNRALKRRDQPTLIEVPVGPFPSPWEFLHMPRVRG